MKEDQVSGQRYIVIDFIRGCAVLLMVFFHLAFDLNGFHIVVIDFLNHPFWYCLPRFIVSLFLICVGMGLALVHKNSIRWHVIGRRFFRIGGWASVITVVTYMVFPERFVFFGILHCIAVASVVGVFFVDKPRLSFFVFLLFVVSNLIFRPTLVPVSKWLGVDSMDYIPFYPWFGLVLLGVYLESINLHKIPLKKLFPIGLFEIMGKHSLKIYLIHRPVIFGLVFSLYKLKAFH
ncbi:MAG: heparan-alpha-glucosaminide N-acetyltransferase [Pseudomonadota bacterium]